MEYYQKIGTLIVILLVALGVYFANTNAQTKVTTPQNASTELQALLEQSVQFASNATNYRYAFAEITDGYRTDYTLITNGNQSRIEVSDKLASKNITIEGNETIMCISYLKRSGCTDIEGNSELSAYLNALEAKFFSNQVILNNENDLGIMINHKYLKFNGPDYTDSINGIICQRVNYTVDFTNATFDDASRFGIGVGSPSKFYMSMCVQNSTGMPIEQETKYTSLDGKTHSYILMGLSFEKGVVGRIEKTNFSGENAIGIFRDEKYQQGKIANCILKLNGTAKDQCMSNLAIELRSQELCTGAGTWTDRCLVSLVPVTKDAGICAQVNDQATKDDCYIELAGAYKNTTYCNLVHNESKTTACMSAAAPEPVIEINNSITNAHENNRSVANNSFVNETLVQQLFQFIENSSSPTNSSNDGNWTNRTG